MTKEETSGNNNLRKENQGKQSKPKWRKQKKGRQRRKEEKNAQRRAQETARKGRWSNEAGVGDGTESKEV
jgi:hypothetical protein